MKLNMKNEMRHEIILKHDCCALCSLAIDSWQVHRHLLYAIFILIFDIVRYLNSTKRNKNEHHDRSTSWHHSNQFPKRALWTSHTRSSEASQVSHTCVVQKLQSWSNQVDHRVSADHGVFHPELSTTSRSLPTNKTLNINIWIIWRLKWYNFVNYSCDSLRGQLMEWVRAPITGKLSEIPGVGPAAITHLSTVTEETK